MKNLLFVYKNKCEASKNFSLSAVSYIKTLKAISGLSFKSSNTLSIPSENFTDKHIKKYDVIVVVGGDGTFLSVSRRIGNSSTKKEIPLIGANLGFLGFLTEHNQIKEVFNQVEKIIEGTVKIEKRMMLEVTVLGKDRGISKVNVLNDAVISNGKFARLISQNVRTKDDFVYKVRADGLIISTPTGSTAYSLSAGGPIVQPTLDILLLTPICPHTLSSRPLIFSGSEELSIELLSNTETYLTYDGQENTVLNKGDIIQIKKSNKKISLVKSDKKFFDIMREKLNFQN